MNEAPAFTSSATFSLAENTTAVGTVTATDPDAADSVTGYTLSGTGAALFQVTTAGALTVMTAPDFEEPEGGTRDDSNSYTLTVTNVDETPPPPPPPPERPRAPSVLVSLSGNTATVSWNEPNLDGDSLVRYELEMQRPGGTWEGRHSGTSRSYSESLNSGSGTYEFRVRAITSRTGRWGEASTTI